MRGRLRSIGQYAIAIFILFGLPVLLIQLGLWLWKPMFHNDLIVSDRVPFAYWARQGPYCDERGNAATADYRRNLLVVFLTANSKVASGRFWYPRSRQGGAAFPALHDEDTLDFFVPERTNRLFVFAADGTRKELLLAADEAERIHKLMEPYPQPPDLVQLLERAYAEKHSPASSASLREAIATLQAKPLNGDKYGLSKSRHFGALCMGQHRRFLSPRRKVTNQDR